MLLALRNDRGTVASGTMYQQAVAGAILADLMLRKRVAAVAGRRTVAEVVDPTPLGDPLLDECLGRMRAATRRRTLQAWVGRFAGLRRLKHRVAAGLVEKGVLRATEETVLLLFTRRVYPEVDGSVEQRIVGRLSDAIFSDTAAVDPRTTVLVALAHHARLLRPNFDRHQLKARRDRINALIKGDLVGEATKAAIAATQAALAVAAVMPAVIAARH
jgi:hypothetical protein